MPHRKEVFENNHFYHIIFRGFNRKSIFLKERDKLRFLLTADLVNKIPPRIEFKLDRWESERMKNVLDGKEKIPTEWQKRSSPLVNIQTFSLLNNHVHFLVEQITSGGVQEFAQRLQNSFAKFFNIKYRNRGPVFETFKAVPITDDLHFRYVVGYITLNVLDTAGIEWRKVRLKESWNNVEKILGSYQWSSYHHFIRKDDFRSLIGDGLAREAFSTTTKFKKHLKSWQENDEITLSNTGVRHVRQ